MESKELKEFGISFCKRGKCVFSKTRSDGSGELEFTDSEDMLRAIKELDRRRFAGSDDKLKAFELR